jgi:hypothetical protein
MDQSPCNYICHNDRRLSQLNVANAITFRCLCPVQMKYVSYLLWIVLTASILTAGMRVFDQAIICLRFEIDPPILTEERALRKACCFDKLYPLPVQWLITSEARGGSGGLSLFRVPPPHACRI